MLSAGQSVQKKFHTTVVPERVYTPQTKFQCAPLIASTIPLYLITLLSCQAVKCNIMLDGIHIKFPSTFRLNHKNVSLANDSRRNHFHKIHWEFCSRDHLRLKSFENRDQTSEV